MDNESIRMVPKEALEYIRGKQLAPAFSYKDVWNEEHATAFTVAKAMQVDVLSDIKGALEKALEEGLPFDTFRDNLKPLLVDKGWWGRKEVTDPLTGKTISAQLGSDRRLRTIYDTNVRSAFERGVYERSMRSEAHPYFMYRLGASVRHREQHLRWDGLILPKDDPWWNTHYPPNGWGCKCYVVPVSEARKVRYENEGVSLPPKADGSERGTLTVKTSVPRTRYYTFYNERKGTLERIPEGIKPGFNWGPGMSGRNTALLQSVIDKLQDKVPEHADAIAKSLLTNTANASEYSDFIRKSLKRELDSRYLSAVGIVDKNMMKALGAEGVNLAGNNIIMLESRLVTSGKYSGKHTIMQNAPLKADWYRLMDYLMDSSVYLDGDGLIFLYKKSESSYMKIAVDISLKNRSHRGVSIMLPKVDTMYSLDIASEADRGIREYQRIITLKKIR